MLIACAGLSGWPPGRRRVTAIAMFTNGCGVRRVDRRIRSGDQCATGILDSLERVDIPFVIVAGGVERRIAVAHHLVDEWNDGHVILRVGERPGVCERDV